MFRRTESGALLVPADAIRETKFYLPDMAALMGDVAKQILRQAGKLLPESEHVHAHTPQTMMFITMVPCEAAFESTPTITEIPLLTVPDNEGWQIRLNGCDFICVTAPADAGGVVGDLEWVDDSDSDAVANLKAAYDFTAATIRVNNEVWKGTQILDPGDTVNMEMATDGSISTPGTGHGLQVNGRILQRMAG